jgi:hypothetical protein
MKLSVENSLTDTKKALRRIIEPERSEKVEDLTIFYLPPNTNWEIKSRRTRCGEGGGGGGGTYCKIGGNGKDANFNR